LGGWADGFLAEGWRIVGFDNIEQPTYPGEFRLRDVSTIHGSELADADCLVLSPPCQEYSYRAMPWKRAKALPPPSNELFDACFRIQREACEAAGRHIPLIVENVKGAQPWVGRAKWHYGSFYLWGDVPVLMPSTRNGKVYAADNPDAFCWRKNGHTPPGIKQPGHSGRAWFADPDVAGHLSSKSPARKAASAQIAKIPFPLAQYIARCFLPVEVCV
jgi:hypothetical protein